MSGFVAQYRLDGRWIGDRNEGWREATAWLNHQLAEEPQPVFLCAGLLEDHALRTQRDPRLVEYCLFPVRGIWRVNADYVEPLPTTIQTKLTFTQKQFVYRSGKMALIMRTSPSRIRAITRSIYVDLLRSDDMLARSLQERRFGNVVVILLSVQPVADSQKEAPALSD
jgi:hypothetical protein